MTASYGELAQCPIADFSDLFAERKKSSSVVENADSVSDVSQKATAGQKAFFVVTKILELMAIPLLAVVTVALAPIMLPLFGLFLLVDHFARRKPSAAIGNFFILPVLIMSKMVEWTLFGKNIAIKPLTKNQDLLRKSAAVKKLNCNLMLHEKLTKSTQISGIAITALAVAAAIGTVALFFTTALIPLIVLWPVVAVCGCAAIFGVVIFGFPIYGLAYDRRNSMEKFINFLRTPTDLLSDDLDIQNARKELLWERVRAVNPNSNVEFDSINDALDSWLGYGADTKPSVWERILDVLEIPSNGAFAHAAIGPDSSKASLLLNLFTHCKKERTLVRALKLFNWSSFVGVGRTPFFWAKLAALRGQIDICARRSQSIYLEAEGAKRYFPVQEK
ncbi:MAG: hypothetical protein LBT98_02105 [Puniceicoccales bacterium]|jgi:hypothetical protein|nr:hypothetical protein [Puniceicoccales bacterium]